SQHNPQPRRPYVHGAGAAALAPARPRRGRPAWRGGGAGAGGRAGRARRLPPRCRRRPPRGRAARPRRGPPRRHGPRGDAEASAATGRRIHMHLLESPRQRVWLDQRFPEGVVRYLDRIGFLSPRLAIAHGVQLRPDECELLAERGVTLVSNPSANLRLRSGIAPLDEARRAGLGWAVGLDGTGLDDDQDIWREMRLLWLLHGGCEIEPRISIGELFDAAVRRGAAVVGQPP